MIKYKLQFDNTTVEFATESEAVAFKVANNIVAEITSEETTPISINVTPAVVTPRQIRIALVVSGFSLSTIESAIDSLPEPNRSIAKITWEYSVEFQRNNPLLSSMAPMLGLSEAQIDGLFALASTL